MGSVAPHEPQIYTYLPFEDARNEIRLLKYTGISPGLASARLCFDVITAQLPPDESCLDTPPFYALSYCWGSSLELAEIILDGHEISIPYNSEVALRGLITAFQNGAGDVTIPIWIDAICINQKDYEEKAKHLPLMKRLYSTAKTVCVWLGPAGIHTHSALRSLRILEEEKEAWFRKHGQDSVPPDGVLPTPEGCEWEALRILLAVPWFTRVWTIQEIVLAPHAEIFCGRYTFPWNSFASAAQWAWDTHRDVMETSFKSKILLPAMMMVRVKQRREVDQIHVQLSRLLIGTISRGVTKQEDKIYGLLGMRPKHEAERNAIVPSYGQSLCESFTTAAAAIMESEDSLLLLEQMAIMNRIGYSGDSDEVIWPSWVPRLDLENRSWGDRGLSSPVTGINPGNANNNRPAPSIKYNPNGNILQLRGVRVGTVDMTFKPLIKNEYLTTSVETDDWDYIEIARHFTYLWGPGYITEHTPRETILALADSLIVGGYEMEKYSDEKLIRDFGAFMRKAWELHSQSDRRSLARPMFTQDGQTGDIAEFALHVAGRSSRFRHLKISNGRFGMGPEHVLPGDVVVILLGVNVPMAMRRHGGHWKLLGAVYVSGIMKGEYIRSMSEEQMRPKIEILDIC